PRIHRSIGRLTTRTRFTWNGGERSGLATVMSPATLLQLRVHRIHSNSGNSPGGGHPFTFMDAEHLSTPLPAHRINHSSRPSGATFYVERNHRWDTASAVLAMSLRRVTTGISTLTSSCGLRFTWN